MRNKRYSSCQYDAEGRFIKGVICYEETLEAALTEAKKESDNYRQSLAKSGKRGIAFEVEGGLEAAPDVINLEDYD